MKQAVWANTDSRIEITVEHNEVSVHVVYERDIYLTDDVTVTLSIDEFNRLILDAREAIVDEQRKGRL